MEEDGGESVTPFWVQGNTAGVRRGDGLRRRVESAVFSSGILVFLLVVAAVFSLVFVLPSIVSFTSSVFSFRPSSVKKSWDSVNVVLVFLAIVFGVLSRSKNELQKSNPGTPVWYGYRDEARRSNPAAFDRWVESSDRRSFNSGGGGGGGGLRRTFSSYPDLCEMSPRWVSADDQWRFYDDTRVDASRVYDSGQLFRGRSWREVDRVPEAEINKIVYVDTVKEAPIPAPSSPPPATADPAAQEPVFEDKEKVTYESLGPKRKTRARKKRDHDVESKKPVTPPAPAASPPPPPPPPPLPHYAEPKSSKSERKRSSSSGNKGFIISSLYHKRKRKQRSQSVDNLDALLHTSQPPPLHFQLPPPSPPPPPPPPPPSVFHNLFSSKKTKRKKNVIVVATPTPSVPPPPPPPPPTTANPRRTSRPNAGAPSVSRHRAAPEDEKRNIGGESPLIPIPPPPPPPPFFKKSAWKFVVQGDYVRIDSLESSRSGSPDPEELDSDVTPTAAEGGGDRTPFPPSPLFCPSPDVNTKAENFISKFRAGLKLEKMNSMKKQGLGLSNLGPSSELS